MATGAAPRMPDGVLMGPCVGKSAVALDPSRLPVETSRRSAQVAAWTSAPPSRTRATRRRVAHHLIDIIDPDKASAASCATRAETVDEVRAGRVPLLVGGDALLERCAKDSDGR
jgi:tRNA A37 N6-isopentenylltransferase MiaA